MIRQTSLEAYDEILETLGDRQIEVYCVILDYPGICNKEISEHLLLPINCITGRVKELRDLGWVVQDGFKYYNNRKVMCWKVK